MYLPPTAPLGGGVQWVPLAEYDWALETNGYVAGTNEEGPPQPALLQQPAGGWYHYPNPVGYLTSAGPVPGEFSRQTQFPTWSAVATGSNRVPAK